MENHNTHIPDQPLLALSFAIMSLIMACFTDLIHAIGAHEEIFKSADMILGIITKLGSLFMILVSFIIAAPKLFETIKKIFRANRR